MRPAQPTPAERRIDPASPRGVRRLAIAWTASIAVGLGMFALLSGAWTLAQVHHYEDNLRGFEYGDPYPWIAVLLCVLWAIVSLVFSVLKWIRYLRMRRQG